MEDLLKTDELVANLAKRLETAQAKEVVALDIREQCPWTDYFVIATYNSQGHLRGLLNELEEFSKENGLTGTAKPKKSESNDWMLIDWDDMVIHLFSKESRDFYELEKLWFQSKRIYQSS